jgi:hypothetical protein
MRHPGRRFPGVLLQGDTLHIMHAAVSGVLQNGAKSLDDDDRIELEHVVNQLGGLLAHYEQILTEHGIGKPW